MEINQEFIDSLAVDPAHLLIKIAETLNVKVWQAQAVLELHQEGATIPFISRYRKEKTGSLDEVQVRDVIENFTSLNNLETRRNDVIRLIFEQNQLTRDLLGNIRKCTTLTELEELYAPYKKKKKTRGMVAMEKGLEPLSEAMVNQGDAALEKLAAGFVDPEKGVTSAAEALEGAMDILAEKMSQDMDHRKAVKDFYLKDAKLVSKGVGDEEKAKTSVYQMYWDFAEQLSTIKPHRLLALNRGEREGELTLSIVTDETGAVSRLESRINPKNTYHRRAIEDGLKRLLSPSVLREIRSESEDHADIHSITVFSENLKNLLMQQPIKGTRVLGIDPGLRTGTKCACLDETGKFLDYFVVQNHKETEAKALIAKAVKDHKIQLIAIGNGTGSTEIQIIVGSLIADFGMDVPFTVVSEDGASVYSASDVAREEFPDLDLTIRGAISIGRRLQDPLAELVKIDPKSLGVGLYQHDVNQRRLSESLDAVVGSVVNNVGVNLNTASVSLLKYVSGINSTVAKKIVAYREKEGKITSREQLKSIGGMGPKTFEQCAGFLKIAESSDPLDNTWVHPENYPLAREIYAQVQKGSAVPAETRESLKAKYGVGDTTINDLMEEMKKPNRDPREDYPKPILQKGALKFEDLKIGEKVTGQVKNVVDFGAFVDIGLKETGLIHVSEMSDSFVKDPMSVLKVGDVKEFTVINLDTDRRRIGLSLKTGVRPAGGGQRQESGVARTPSTAGKLPASGTHNPRPGTGSARPADRGAKPKDDDGMTYNPFAQAFAKKEGSDKGDRKK